MVEDSQGGPTPDSPWPRVEISWEEQQAKPYGDRGGGKQRGDSHHSSWEGTSCFTYYYVDR